jgi:hypothetical protein
VTYIRSSSGRVGSGSCEPRHALGLAGSVGSADLRRAKLEELDEVPGGSERVTDRLAVSREGRRRDDLALDVGDDERAARERFGIESREAFERGDVA